MRFTNFRGVAAMLTALSLSPAIVAGAQGVAPAGMPIMAADTADPAYASGAAHGDSIASAKTEFHWFGRGFIAGVLTGPVGTWWAVRRAGRNGPDSPVDDAELASSDPAYRQGYRQAYTRRLRTERKEYAFMGGALGTAVFTYALIRLVQLQDHASARGDPGGGGGELVRIPLAWR